VIRAVAPGRVNLIGDHTDHTGGLVLPMAIDLGTTVSGQAGGAGVTLRSAHEAEPALVALDVSEPSAVRPGWARYVAGVVAEVRPATGFTGAVASTLPVGAGLSSSAALEVAVALALGFRGTALELARACQVAEQRASGVPCGIMDQLASAAGVAGHALRIDCTTLDVRPVPMPPDVEVIVVDSGQRRELAMSAYGERAAACQAAEARIGPLRDATVEELAGLPDETMRRRVRHVITENRRVDELATALVAGDRSSMAATMAASHRSLRDDFEVSTPVLDSLVETLGRVDGVIGARPTGAGFGGCIVALVEAGATPPDDLTTWPVRAAAGARILREDEPDRQQGRAMEIDRPGPDE
jgi:galactokinase